MFPSRVLAFGVVFLTCVYHSHSAGIGYQKYRDQATSWYKQNVTKTDTVNTDDPIDVWQYDRTLGRYVVPYTIGNIQHAKSKEELEWAMNYIQKGSNIQFVPRGLHSRSIEFVSGSNCETTIGRCPVASCPLRIVEGLCSSRSALLHLLMHVLGFADLHRRLETPEYMAFKSDATALYKQFNQPNYTYPSGEGFDLASIMKHDDFFDLTRAYASYEKVFRHTYPVLSSCDWAKLNTAYPPVLNTKDPKYPPFCTPHQIPDSYGVKECSGGDEEECRAQCWASPVMPLKGVNTTCGVRHTNSAYGDFPYDAMYYGSQKYGDCACCC